MRLSTRRVSAGRVSGSPLPWAGARGPPLVPGEGPVRVRRFSAGYRAFDSPLRTVERPGMRSENP